MEVAAQRKLLRKGAEACIYLERWHGRRVVAKTRVAKPYRVGALDQAIRASRTAREAHLIHDAKRAGVPTPSVYMVDLSAFTIIMDYIEGPRLKEAMQQMSADQRSSICEEVGGFVGRLHLNGIVHGDLTTSNVIMSGGSKAYLVDFGLSDYSEELEARGVDLLLMNRALGSTHFAYSKQAFRAVVRGYEKVMGREAALEALQRMREVERRGRYSERAQQADLLRDVK